MSQSILPPATRSRQCSPQADTPKIAAIYARVSTTDQADNGYSLPTQIEACQKLAHKEGYTVPDTYIFVDDYTGTSLNRPQLIRLRDLVRQQVVQAVIVYDLDRLSRKLAHQLLLTDELEAANVVLHVVTMPATNKTPETQLLANVRGSIAEYERSKILERTMRGLRGRAQAGRPPGGAVPLGYRYVRTKTEASYEIDPEEAALVQRIFQMYVHEELSFYAIAKELTRTRTPTQHDRRGIGPARKLNSGVWHPASLYDLLTNETYIGTLYYGKSERVPSSKNQDKRTTWRTRPKEEWIAIAVPAIIDVELFDAAQKQRGRNARNSRRNRKHDYLLAGHLMCENCGCKMHGRCDERYNLLFYHCTRPGYQLEIPCRGTISATRLETIVWTAVEGALCEPESIAQLVAQRQHGTDTEQSGIDRERSFFAGQVAQCDKEVQKWEQAYIADAIDVQDLKTKKAEVLARRVGLEREMARLEQQQRALEQFKLKTASIIEYCQQVRENMQPFDFAAKRRTLEALDIKVIWHHDKPLEPVITGSIPVTIAPDAPWCTTM